jgi:uncharacterized protein YggT (Ycf19 family)
MIFIIEFILALLSGMQLFLILGTILPLFLPADNMLKIGILRIIDPLLRPFRKVIKPISGFDFTPLVLYLLLRVIESLVRRFLLPLAVK